MKAYRLAVLGALALATLPLAALSACGSSSPSQAGDDDDDDASTSGAEAGGGGGDDGSTSDSQISRVPVPESGTSDGSTGMDVAVDAPPPSNDGGEPPPTQIDCNEMIDQTQVFVSSTGSDGMVSCTNDMPCATIGKALGVAATSGATTVYIEEGTYTEQVTIPTTIRRITGGWNRSGSNWTVDCTPARLQATTIAAPGSVNQTIIAKDLGGTTSLESLNIKSKGTAGASESLYGIFATGPTTTLTLLDTSVTVANGGDGAAGSAGGAGTPAPATCAVGNDPATAATPAAPATTGGANVAYSAAGAIVSTAPPATQGGSGGDGNIPAPQCAQAQLCTKDDGNCDTGPVGQECAPPATAGCGGGPGGVGGGGGGGGSSIGIFAWDATVTTTGGELKVGNGGAGGPGGTLGSGAAGSAGVESNILIITGCSGACVATREHLYGPAGVNGASGADGVGGAGGSGGDSFVYYSNANKVMVTTSTAIPGLGGDAGAGAATGVGAATAPSGKPGLGEVTNL